MASKSRRDQRIAIVGTGISGLSAAWLLNQSTSITVFEQRPRIGGHSHTVNVASGSGSTAVDMGFIVYNEPTYPNLTALFQHLDVETQTTDMSLAVSLGDGRLEYGGGYLGQLFAQRRNLFRPRFYSMLRDLVRFYRSAPRDLPELEHSAMALGAYLKKNRYGEAFIDDHLLPMAAAIWSVPTSSVLEYPAHAFIRFHENHGLLKLTNRPLWRTVTGGSRCYVEKISSSFAHSIRKAEGVVSIERLSDGVALHTDAGGRERYDEVVIASHADSALAMLQQPTPEERSLLGAFRYQPNTAILHSDTTLMPKRRRAWASWNYIAGKRHETSADLTVTYWMNSLQNLSHELPLFVTLNPNREIAAAKIHQVQKFDHPIIDHAAMNAQRKLWSLQGRDRIWYCGSYFGAGFHEDGLQAGLAVAEAIAGTRRPWQVADESGRIFVTPRHPERVLAGAVV
ncbi:MAG: FAD-dependent oxidoreductase [Alphaproteobacteria bacterium]|nr:FAD-dependent oxidoreductase [Alphaproteobacteria bacterium]